jgi:imidazolonepropionase-like amidohydrolase
MRDAIREGRVQGPNLFFAGLVDGPGPEGFGEFSAATPAEGRALVRRYHELGFEMIKIYLALAPDVTAAICDEAHRLGMMCTGHVPRSMDLHAAIDAGMDQFAHFPVRGDMESAEGRQQIAHFLEKKVVFDPTASWGEIGGKSAQEPMQNIQPVLQHLPVPLLQHRVANLGNGQSDTATAHARLARTLANIKAVHDAGVPIIAGTDEGIPAYSIYREIELYVKAGFTPMEALRAATAVPAQAMRVYDDVGTIEVGKRADLLVLDANPLIDVSNIRSVRFVMKDGRLFDNAALWRGAGFKP